MRARLAVLALVGVIAGGCRDDARGGTAGSGAAAASVRLRARPAATVEVTLKALGVT